MDRKYCPPFTTKKEIVNMLNSLNLFTELIKKAIEIAIVKHKNQKRDNGQPFLEQHIFPMTKSIILKHKKNKNLEEMLITAFLHDVVEDHNFSIEEIEKIFGENIAENIFLLTKPTKNKTEIISHDLKFDLNKKMIEKIKNAKKIVQIIKLEDRLNNMKSTKNILNEKYKRYLKETKEIYIPFAKQISDHYVEKLMGQINRLEKAEDLF